MALQKTNEIHETTDYDQFKGIIGNREIYKPHLNRLIASIDKHNMLPANPIIVNKNMEVIDGQHRLLAAKQLEIPVSYVIIDEGDLEAVQELQTHRSWTTVDFLESYMALGKKDYIRLAQFAEEYRLSLASAIILLGTKEGGHFSTASKAFKTGRFTIVDYDRAERVASLMNEIRRFSPDKVWTDREFLRAVMWLDGKVDPKRIVETLERYKLSYTRRPSVRAYLQEFEDILNFDARGTRTQLV